jgi:ABC-2 type transport system ATP-binding protein
MGPNAWWAAGLKASIEAPLAFPPPATNFRAVGEPILEIRGLSKTYKGGVRALDSVDLDIQRGEIFALLGPNGAGKTTLIGAVCGLVRPTGGTIRAFGEDTGRHWRQVRRRIGLVPQELAFDMFARVDHSVEFSRGMFGCAPSKARIEEVLRSLSLWDKRESKIRELSGGMKRRVMIAKALSHDPELLFLDEPTAGVDVELRRDMWRQIGALREKGTTIILTTHYIEEAQEMADRVGVINKGKLLLVDDKDAIMARLGRTEARIALGTPMSELPAALAGFPLTLEDEGRALRYRGGDGTGKGKREIADLLRLLVQQGIPFEGIETRESSLEDIFVDLVENRVEVPA